MALSKLTRKSLGLGRAFVSGGNGGGYSFGGAAKNPLWDFFRKFAQDFFEQYAVDEADEKMGTKTKTKPTLGGMAETSLRDAFMKKKKPKNNLNIDFIIDPALLYQNVITSQILNNCAIQGNNLSDYSGGINNKFLSFNIYDNFPSYYKGTVKKNYLKRALMAIFVAFCIRSLSLNLIPVFHDWVETYVDGLTDREVDNAIAQLNLARNG